jgi:uncharacterized protein (DUF433 family)
MGLRPSCTPTGTASKRRREAPERVVSVDRFATLLYGIGEAAAYLSIPPSTLASWSYGHERRVHGGGTERAAPVITAVRPASRDEAAVPFVGLAEAYALTAFRKAGLPMQRIRPAIDVLSRELGLEHALASRQLYTDGAEVLDDYARHAGDTPEGDSASDGYARLIRLPQYDVAEVTVDPDHSFGRPRMNRGGAEIDDIVDLLQAGEPVDVVAAEFGLCRDELEDLLRAAVV